ncbi:MAG: site-specific DNA-methyltransferase, partial [Atopostipes sp.]|nr:site-specific DNA-methyltransferase [Atopostipes sp.]
GNDSFKYNDKFNHSTWLTFMRNRLEIANELLSSEGSIWINIDDDEAHYLKVMCDEIFGRENFITNIVWQKKYTIANDAKFFSDNHDHILVYAKNKNNYEINGLPRTLEMNERYKNPDNDPNGPWMSQPLHAKSGNDEKFSFTFKNGVTWEPPRGTFPRHTKESLEEYDSENKIWFGVNGDAVPRLKKYLSDMGDVTPATIWLHQDFGNNDQANKEVRALISTEEFSTPKPEKLIQQILKIGSNEEDIVLDFFMGSGTTQAVAHKMNRQYIGIEQMDYINTVSVPRLEKVIEGEQGGISKEVDWEGGGSFVYAELATLNDEYVQDVQASKSEEELEIVLSTMKERAYLNFKVDLEKVSLEEEGYKKLTLEEKKEVLIQVLDMNQLYLSYSEMEDEQYEILEDVKAFNHSFYQKDGEENE